jgi:hypothetical protein
MHLFIYRVVPCLSLCAFLLLAKPAPGISLDYFLTVDVTTNTWELAASTDSPGGIAAIIVNLTNYGTGYSVAPRSVYQGAPVRGFIVGNPDLPATDWPSDHENYNQAWSAQFPIDVESLTYRIGYSPVSNSVFGADQPPIEMIGSAMTVPTIFYVGTYNPANGLPDFAAKQPEHPFAHYPIPGAVYINPPPPGGYEIPVHPSDVTYRVQQASYSVRIVPEPAAILLAVLSAPAVYLLRRRLVGVTR